ncbi:MAG: hypothetical protein J6V06_01970 [Clostridia bacterium]|nr:hypothetical protein [Clostridia bacterium]
MIIIIINLTTVYIMYMHLSIGFLNFFQKFFQMQNGGQNFALQVDEEGAGGSIAEALLRRKDALGVLEIAFGDLWSRRPCRLQ